MVSRGSSTEVRQAPQAVEDFDSDVTGPRRQDAH
jgi:hypothetical protein